ncbi:hypothetical protein GQX73_g9491 [Xylaria multiplex]|uniref:Uncharacterized protein n=1 Tax=Xylaria multiplex TaxID=323545 RepID=A0A7C8IHV9_9PEZI|nr:hypothetical protein GQX73_g9491 [Xylaria multiplex]
MRKIMAETKISLAANQLSEQVKDSMKFWRGFRDEYSKEVNDIKLYVGVGVLQQIWRKKVEFNSNDRHSDQKFTIQSMKLESCLNQVDEATRLLTGLWSSDHGNDYDSRQHHLAKTRAAGNLVVGLSKRAATDEAACIDLLEELSELEKLVDPKSINAGMLHHFGKHQPQNSARSVGNIGDQGYKEPELGDIDEPEHDGGGGNENWRDE